MRDMDFIAAESYTLLCDNKIGHGMSREVYTSIILPNSVIKIEKDTNHFQNISEWQVWRTIMYTDFAKWFAPCEYLSNNGAILIMKKTSPITVFPDKVPAFFTDFKPDNWGMYNGHPVCHDYGLHLLMEKGMTRAMRKVNWQEHHS